MTTFTWIDPNKVQRQVEADGYTVERGALRFYTGEDREVLVIAAGAWESVFQGEGGSGE